MTKIVWLCGGLLAFAAALPAQEFPKYDVFGGYSYVHYNQSQSGGNVTANLNGGVGAVAVYPSKWLGFVADFGGYKIGSIKQGSASLPVSGTVIDYLFGPRIRFGTGAVTPFAQVLFGGVRHGDITTSNAGACSPAAAPCVTAASDNGFGMAAEGGIDVKVAKHLALRGQAGYLMTRFSQDTGSGTQAAMTQNNVRVSVGIVIR